MMISGFYRASLASGLALCAALATLLCVPLNAAENPASARVDEAHSVAITIDSENLIELYQSVPGLRIIDSRLREDHRLGHIELSRNLPIDETNCKSLSRIAADKDTAMVFYCNGNDADAGIDALKVASACGYRRLFWLRGGFIEWQDKDYPFVVE